MEFGIGKYAMLKIRSKKRQVTGEVELPNQERTISEKQIYNFLGI